MNGFEELFKG